MSPGGRSGLAWPATHLMYPLWIGGAGLDRIANAGAAGAGRAAVLVGVGASEQRDSNTGMVEMVRFCSQVGHGNILGKIRTTSTLSLWSYVAKDIQVKKWQSRSTLLGKGTLRSYGIIVD